MLAALATVFDIHTVSRPYPDRPPSTLERVYIDGAIKCAPGERSPAIRHSPNLDPKRLSAGQQTGTASATIPFRSER